MQRAAVKYLIVTIAALALATSIPTAGQGQDIVDLARRDGKVVWYTSVALEVAEVVAKAFEGRYRIKVDVVRTGSERVLTRVLQEDKAGVKNVDVIHTSDAGHFVLLKEKGLLMPYRPEGTDEFPRWFRLDTQGEGAYFVWRASLCTPMYNTRIVRAEDAPTGWMDLLAPKWKGKLVMGHPGYSGIIMTCVAALTKLYGWEYFEKLKANDVMIRQSANDPPTVVAAGERSVGANGAEYYAYGLRIRGNPVAIVYPKEGIPLVESPSAIARFSPRPNAAKLFTNFIYSRGVQQLLVDETGLYVPHPTAKYPADKPKLEQLKLLQMKPDELEKRSEEIKERFTKIFGI